MLHPLAHFAFTATPKPVDPRYPQPSASTRRSGELSALGRTVILTTTDLESSVDSSSRIISFDQRVALIDAIVASSTAPESDWLEAKGPDLDLTQKWGAGKVATAIVGMANRDSATAARHCDGYGYIVVGAVHGKSSGIRQVDPTIVEDKVNAYLGAVRPAWTLTWVPYDTGHVLVFEVPPAPAGSHIFCLAKATPTKESGESVPAGTIMVRRGSKTDRHNPEDLHRLTNRAASENHLHDVEVVYSSGLVQLVSMGADEWLAREERECLASLPRRRRTAADPYGLPSHRFAVKDMDATFRAAVGETRVKEERTEAEYRTGVAEYLDECRKHLPRMTQAFATQLPPVTLKLVNASDRYWEGLNVVVHLSGDSDAFRALPPEANSGPRMPRRPRSYGDYYVNRFNSLAGFAANVSTAHLGAVLPARLPGAGASVRIRHTESVELTFHLGSLQPEHEVSLPPVVVTLGNPNGQTVVADWAVTGNCNGVVRGTVELPVAPELVLISTLLTDATDE